MKLEKQDVPLIVGTKNNDFTSHKDIGQNFQDKEETSKVNNWEISSNWIKSNSVKGRLGPPTHGPLALETHWLKRRELLISLSALRIEGII